MGQNYFNTLPLRLQLEELGKCRFMDHAEFSNGCDYLKGKKIVIVGCGAQGLNQGLNLRDSGLDVSYALRESAIVEQRQSWKNASENGFPVGTYEELIPAADIVMNLTPDKQHTSVVNAVMPLMKEGACLDYAHGFNLVEEGIDLAVRIAHLSDSTMVAVPVGHVRRVVCGSPALLRSDGIPKHPRELSERPCVQFRGINPGSHWSFRDGGREISVKTRGAFTCNQAAATAAACAEGLGFGMFLSYQVEPLIRAKSLEVVLADFEPPTIPVSLVYPETRLTSTRLRALVDWLKEGLRARPEIH